MERRANTTTMTPVIVLPVMAAAAEASLTFPQTAFGVTQGLFTAVRKPRGGVMDGDAG